METTKTIQQIAEEMLSNFERSKRENGSEYYHTKEIIDWQKDIIYKAHFDGERLPNDDIYDRIHTFLSNFSDLDEDANEEDFQNLIYQTEPDVYTADLTSWLAENINNVYYLTEALQEFEIKDGFQLLQLAQQKYIQEIGQALLDGITEHLESISA